MPEGESRIRRLVHWVATHAIWDCVKWLGGSSILSSIGHLCWLEFHHAPVDWSLLAALFVGGLIFVALGVWLQSHNEDKSEKKNKNRPLAGSAAEESVFSPLQIEAFRLAKDIRGYLLSLDSAQTKDRPREHKLNSEDRIKLMLES